MASSAQRVITGILLILAFVTCLNAQTPAEKAASGSISGKVTIKGKPAVKVVVVASEGDYEYSPSIQRNRTKTDQTGSYRITNLPAGTYRVFSITPSLVSLSEQTTIVVSEGEPVEDVNIQLTPGGVITGKITDSEGEPLIGQTVKIIPMEQRPGGISQLYMRRLFIDHSTDDRGIYRAFGIPAGKYKVSVGNNHGFGPQNSRLYTETFYPSVIDPAKATILEVTEGSETKNVDIMLGRPVKAFKIAGRVVDGETGTPIPNISYGVGKTFGDNNSGSFSSVGSDVTAVNGEFQIENATPGKYTIFTASREGSDIPGGSVSFEVIDRDVTDLVIKVTKGNTLSGVAVLDSNERFPSGPRALRICAQVESKEPNFNQPSGEIGPDGSFRISGVQNGIAHLSLCSFADNKNQFEIVGVEHNGVPQPATINVKGNVTGLRVMVKLFKLTGSIRGQLKVEDGELPPTSQLGLSLWPLDQNLQPKPSHSLPSPQLDARGRFFIDRLPAGTYRLSVHRLFPGRNRSEISQQVIVTDDTETEVTLTIKP